MERITQKGCSADGDQYKREPGELIGDMMLIILLIAVVCVGVWTRLAG